VHEELAKSGHEAVVSEMGTEAGARYLSRRHGYVTAPLGDEKNRWIKCLRTAPESGIRGMSPRFPTSAVKPTSPGQITNRDSGRRVRGNLSRSFFRVEFPAFNSSNASLMASAVLSFSSARCL
jgi:hypothetical protein